MDFGVLGPLRVQHGGAPLEIGALKQRALLIHLILRVGQTVSIDRLIDALWEQEPPPQARATLRSYVSSLRRVLDTDDGPVIVTRGNGYGLQVPPETVDAVRFARLVTEARNTVSADPAVALGSLDEALGLWRGEALSDVADSTIALGERTRLEELRLSAMEDRFEALLMLGHHAEAVAGLEAFTAEVPLRERAQGLLMTALYGSGRTADALAVFKRFRESLVEELGLEPTSRLQQLAEKILRQDEILAPGATAAPLVVAPQEAAAAAPDLAQQSGQLVGRTHERAELQRVVQRLIGGTGGLVLVTGEPGIGKSTMLDQLAFMASAAGARVQWGRCQETKGAPAFWPWMQVLRDIAANLDDTELRVLLDGPAAAVTHLVAGIAARLDTPPPVLDDDLEAARFQLYDAIAAFLLRVAEQRGLVLLLDDLHWADAATLETLSFLAPLLGSARVLVAGTYRDRRGDWANDLEATLATVVREPFTQQVGLVGLQPDAVAALAERLTGDAMSPDERDLLHERTGGNPFFVCQLSQLQSETGQRGVVVRAIPRAVTHVIARRLSLLRAEVRELLEQACVVGAQFDVRWLAGATGTDVDAALDAADAAAEYGLIEPVGRSATTYRFVHALVRETIYDSLGPVRAARIHAQVATALELNTQTPLTTLAEHFLRASDVIDDNRPVEYLVAAADDALKVFAHEQAEIYLRNALQLVTDRHSDPAVELRVRVRLVELLTHTQGWTSMPVEEIAEPARRLARVAGARADVLPLWTALFVQYMTRGDAPIARQMVEQLLADADQWGDPATIAASRIAAAQLEMSQGGAMSRAQDYARQAVLQADLAAERAPAGDPAGLRVPASYMLACSLAVDGQVAKATEQAQRSITLAEDTGDAFLLALTHMIVGWLAMIMEELPLAADSSEKSVALAQQHGFQHVALTATIGQSWARARLGGDPPAEAARMREAVDALTRAGHKAEQARRLLFTAETFLLGGDHAAAAGCLEEARAFAHATGEILPATQLERITSGLAAMRVGTRAARHF